jgi:hypothetical protein
MAKKVYDVKPPKVAKKTEKDIKEFLNQGNPKKRTTRRKKENKSSFWKYFLIAAAIVVIVLSVFLYFKLQRATVEIWPKVDEISSSQVITADESIDNVDIKQAVIPAQHFQEEKSGSQEFSATGNASNEGKATGTITIYNKYNPPSAITLKAGTHFLSDSGKYFVTLQKVVIPAASKSGSKITPGSVQVKVEATEGGESYNKGPANFSVPKLSGTDYYYSIYAVSTNAMNGGYAGKIKKITDEDIDLAKADLIEKLKSEAVASLKDKISQEYVLLDDAISVDIVNAKSDKKSGTVADNFTEEATIKVNAIAFKKSDLEKFAKDYILTQMPEQKTMLESSFKVDYNLKNLDIENGKMVIESDIYSKIYQTINKNSLALSLLKKNASQIQVIIKDQLGSEVLDAKIKFWPFWTTKTPSSQKGVKIELIFE